MRRSRRRAPRRRARRVRRGAALFLTSRWLAVSSCAPAKRPRAALAALDTGNRAVEISDALPVVATPASAAAGGRAPVEALSPSDPANANFAFSPSSGRRASEAVACAATDVNDGCLRRVSCRRCFAGFSPPSPSCPLTARSQPGRTQDGAQHPVVRDAEAREGACGEQCCVSVTLHPLTLFRPQASVSDATLCLAMRLVENRLALPGAPRLPSGACALRLSLVALPFSPSRDAAQPPPCASRPPCRS